MAAFFNIADAVCISKEVFEIIILYDLQEEKI